VLSWTRRARGNGDAWAAANVPLGAVTERYVLDIKTVANAVVRRVSLSAPTYTYTNAQELADFGSVQAQLVLTIRQIGDDDREGEPLTRTITV
jgi:pyruvate-formate lyase-activating enzyme